MAKNASKDDLTVEPLETKEAPKSKELCWNCTNHGEKNRLSLDGTCEVCGFDKNTLYNGNLEADKAAQRAEAARAAERI